MSEFKAFGLFRGGKVHRAKCVRFRCVIPSFIHPSIPRVHTREQHVTHTSVRDVCPARPPSGHSPRPARPPPPAPQPRTVRRVLPCAPAAPSAACPCVGVHAAGRPSRRSCLATTCGAASFSLCVVSFLPSQPPPGRAELRAACQGGHVLPGAPPRPRLLSACGRGFRQSAGAEGTGPPRGGGPRHVIRRFCLFVCATWTTLGERK